MCIYEITIYYTTQYYSSYDESLVILSELVKKNNLSLHLQFGSPVHQLDLKDIVSNSNDAVINHEVIYRVHHLEDRH